MKNKYRRCNAVKAPAFLLHFRQGTNIPLCSIFLVEDAEAEIGIVKKRFGESLIQGVYPIALQLFPGVNKLIRDPVFRIVHSCRHYCIPAFSAVSRLTFSSNLSAILLDCA